VGLAVVVARREGRRRPRVHRRRRIHGFASAIAIDREHSAVAWEATPTGATPDYTVVELRIQRDTASWDWTIVGPGNDTGGRHIPVIPTDLQSFAPAAGDAVQIEAANNVSIVGGYDGVREHFYDASAPTPHADYALIEGAPHLSGRQ